MNWLEYTIYISVSKHVNEFVQSFSDSDICMRTICLPETHVFAYASEGNNAETAKRPIESPIEWMRKLKAIGHYLLSLFEFVCYLQLRKLTCLFEESHSFQQILHSLSELNLYPITFKYHHGFYKRIYIISNIPCTQLIIFRNEIATSTELLRCFSFASSVEIAPAIKPYIYIVAFQFCLFREHIPDICYIF